MELMLDRRSEPSRYVMSMPAAALVLLSCGDHDAIAALHQDAAEPLARALGLQLGAALPQDQGCSAIAAQQALATLTAGALSPLPLDPGLPLAGQGHWAEQLGAARQCCLLLLTGEQAGSGLPAAATALLLQWQVPLLGLVQWGSAWDGRARASDALPWLGWLDGTAQAADAAVDLAFTTGQRWHQRRAEGA